MKLVKSLLLGTTAIVSVAAGAQAADLPVRKAEPVAFACPTAYGKGFFVIPGTENCIQFSGFTRLEIGIAEQTNRIQDAIGFRARGRLNVDVRTATAFGTLRSFIRFDARNETGSPFGASFVAPAAGGTGTAALRPTREVRIEQAYVQWGGLIAGRATTFFSPGPRNSYFIGPRMDDASENELLGYVYDATVEGRGFELAVSVENPFTRRTNATAFGIGVAGVGNPAAANAFGSGAFFAGGGNVVTPFAYGGQELPDFVGRATYRDTWGYAYVAGAVHQVNDIGTAAVAATPSVVAGNPAGSTSLATIGGAFSGFSATPGTAVAARGNAGDEIGFAVSAAVDVNLPFLGVGDTAFALVQYSDGAVSYSGYGSSARVGGGGVQGGFGFAGFSGGFGGAGLPVADAVIVNGRLETTEVLSVAAGLQHYWAPQFRSQFYGSYSSVDFAEGASATLVSGPFAGARVGFVDFEEVRIGGNLIFTPVSGLDLGVEVLYSALNPQGRIVVERPADAGVVVRNVRSDVDTFETRLRISRSF